VLLYQYAQHKGKRVALGSKVETLVYVLAHELRHLWQHHGSQRQSSFPTEYARNSRGQFSEVDTESYADNRLRAWRRRAKEPVEPAR
jgi:Zn-dependent peptidase ImmA (M78 family)